MSLEKGMLEAAELQAAEAARAKAERELAALRGYVAALETRHAAVLASETWRAMEPVRRIMRLIRSQDPPRTFVPRTTGAGAKAALLSREKTADRISRAFAAAKSGFLQAGLERLEQIRAHPATDPRSLPHAVRSMILLRADGGDPAERALALEELAQPKEWGKLGGPALDAAAIRLSLLAAEGRLEEARRLAAVPPVGAGGHADFLLLAASLADPAARVAGIAAAFRASAGIGIAPADPALPPTIDNLRGDPADNLRGDPADNLRGDPADNLRGDPADNLSGDPADNLSGDPADNLSGDPADNLRGDPAAAPPDAPLLSVIVPAWNAADTIRTSLRSLVAQSWRNLEILVVDDASRDATAESVAEMADARPADPADPAAVERRRLCRRATPPSPRPRGHLVTCQDADDWSHPDAAAPPGDALLADPSLVANVSHWARATPDLRFERRPFTARVIHFNSSSIMFRREPVSRAIGFWDSVRFAATPSSGTGSRRLFGPAAVAELPELLAIGRVRAGSLSPRLGQRLPGRQDRRAQAYERPGGLARRAPRPTALRLPFPHGSGPFGVPAVMLTGRATTGHFDAVLISDFRHVGGTTASNQQELLAQARAGLRTALVQVDRYDYDVGPRHPSRHPGADRRRRGHRARLRRRRHRRPRGGALPADLQPSPGLPAGNPAAGGARRGEPAAAPGGGRGAVLRRSRPAGPISPPISASLATGCRSGRRCATRSPPTARRITSPREDWFNIIDVDAWKVARAGWRGRARR